ncbi:hypothetical protein POTOM_037688 [Populus tomentosa]|uniref:Uncharacterized protein n=1 Tax=Populus tomentosa TaxID=118781 RepID=A0A8X7YW71_POPTO|nr:hypothetical protein POTOM_037688 [Populus tomentosa]
MASTCQGKSSWPELLGVDGKCAVSTIERENPLVEAIIVPEGSSIIENFRSVSFVRFLREGNGIDDNLANSRLRTGMQNFWFGCDIPVDFCHDQKCLII